MNPKVPSAVNVTTDMLVVLDLTVDCRNGDGTGNKAGALETDASFILQTFGLCL